MFFCVKATESSRVIQQ